MKFFLSVVLCCIVSCSKLEPRYPLNNPKTTLMIDSAKKNKQQLAVEVELIEQWLAKKNDTFRFLNAGVWLSLESIPKSPLYVSENESFTIQISLYDLNDKQLVNNRILTTVKGSRELPQGISNTIPMIPKGVKCMLLIPSLLAYGSSGDGNLIPPNTPLVAHIFIPLTTK